MGPLPPGAGWELCSHQDTLSSTQHLYSGSFPATMVPKFLSSRAALPALQQTAVQLHPPDTVLGVCFSKTIRETQLMELGVL